VTQEGESCRVFGPTLNCIQAAAGRSLFGVCE
jgi:hypothetical protein